MHFDYSIAPIGNKDPNENLPGASSLREVGLAGHIALAFLVRGQFAQLGEVSVPGGHVAVLLEEEVIVAHDVALLLAVEVAKDFAGFAEALQRAVWRFSFGGRTGTWVI